MNMLAAVSRLRLGLCCLMPLLLLLPLCAGAAEEEPTPLREGYEEFRTMSPAPWAIAPYGNLPYGTTYVSSILPALTYGEWIDTVVNKKLLQRQCSGGVVERFVMWPFAVKKTLTLWCIDLDMKTGGPQGTVGMIPHVVHPASGGWWRTLGRQLGLTVDPKRGIPTWVNSEPNWETGVRNGMVTGTVSDPAAIVKLGIPGPVAGSRMELYPPGQGGEFTKMCANHLPQIKPAPVPDPDSWVVLLYPVRATIRLTGDGKTNMITYVARHGIRLFWLGLDDRKYWEPRLVGPDGPGPVGICNYDPRCLCGSVTNPKVAAEIGLCEAIKGDRVHLMCSAQGDWSLAVLDAPMVLRMKVGMDWRVSLTREATAQGASRH